MLRTAEESKPPTSRLAHSEGRGRTGGGHGRAAGRLALLRFAPRTLGRALKVPGQRRSHNKPQFIGLSAYHELSTDYFNSYVHSFKKDEFLKIASVELSQFEPLILS